MILFLIVYAILALFLVRYARLVERRPQASPVYQEDIPERAR